MRKSSNFLSLNIKQQHQQFLSKNNLTKRVLIATIWIIKLAKHQIAILLLKIRGNLSIRILLGPVRNIRRWRAIKMIIRTKLIRWLQDVIIVSQRRYKIASWQSEAIEVRRATHLTELLEIQLNNRITEVTITASLAYNTIARQSHTSRKEPNKHQVPSCSILSSFTHFKLILSVNSRRLVLLYKTKEL